MPEPKASNPADAITGALSKIGLNLGALLPGESVITAAFNYATVRWQNMDSDIQRRWDVIGIEMAEDVWYLWRKPWEDRGLVPKREKSP